MLVVGEGVGLLCNTPLHILERNVMRSSKQHRQGYTHGNFKFTDCIYTGEICHCLVSLFCRAIQVFYWTQQLNTLSTSELIAGIANNSRAMQESSGWSFWCWIHQSRGFLVSTVEDMVNSSSSSLQCRRGTLFIVQVLMADSLTSDYILAHISLFSSGNPCPKDLYPYMLVYINPSFWKYKPYFP